MRVSSHSNSGYGSRALAFLAVCALGCGEAPGRVAPEDRADPSAEADEGYSLEVPTSDLDAPEVGDPATLANSVGGEDAAKYVFGDDDRRAVPRTSVAPYKSVVLIDATFREPGEDEDDEETYGCSGTLVGRDVVLTAAHCVYKPDHGGEAVKVRVTPGAYPDAAGRQRALPLGHGYAKRVFYPAEFTKSAQYDVTAEQHDYAVIRLDRRLGDSTGTRSYASFSKPQGRTTRVIAYRPYVCSTTTPSCNKSTAAMEMYEVRGRVGPIHHGVLFDSYTDGVGGSSGAGIMGDGVDSDTIFALETSESSDRYNSSLLLSPTAVARIRTWASAVVR